MKKKMIFRTTYRVTLGVQLVAWIRTDSSINPKEQVASVLPDYSEQMKHLMLGEVDCIDKEAPTKEFFINGSASVKGGDPDVFLGYITTKEPSYPHVLMRLWPSLTFTNYDK